MGSEIGLRSKNCARSEIFIWNAWAGLIVDREIEQMTERLEEQESLLRDLLVRVSDADQSKIRRFLQKASCVTL